MSSATSLPESTAPLLAFAAACSDVGETVRVRARATVLAVVSQAVANAHSALVELADTDAPAPAQLRARALGRGTPTTPLHAAFLTGLAAADDGLATPVVAAALALGDALDAAGANVLAAVVAGVEVALRIERALGVGHRERGWDTRGTCGRLGAAVAAARILDLPPESFRDAFGIAATAAGGLSGARGTMTFAYIAGAAAADGIEAALLARAGFTAAPLALEGRRGLAALMSPTFERDALLAGLAETFVFAHHAETGAESPSPPASAALRTLVEGIERLASIRELIDATLP